MCEFSVQKNHFHLIVEAEGHVALSRGMNGLCTRLARRLNRCLERKGSLFAERYHARVLGTPREVRNALRYVLNNARHHGSRFKGYDPFSSGWWFTGWLEPQEEIENPPPMSRARSWLLRCGWLRGGGPIPVSSAPA